MKTNYEEITAEIEAKRAREDAVLHVYRTLDIERAKLSQEKEKLQYDIEEKATGSASTQKLSRIEETEKVINALLDYIKRKNPDKQKEYDARKWENRAAGQTGKENKQTEKSDIALVRLNLRIPEDIRDYLQAAAYRESTPRKRVSLTEYLCQLVRQDMERNKIDTNDRRQGT